MCDDVHLVLVCLRHEALLLSLSGAGRGAHVSCSCMRGGPGECTSEFTTV